MLRYIIFIFLMFFTSASRAEINIDYSGQMAKGALEQINKNRELELQQQQLELQNRQMQIQQQQMQGQQNYDGNCPCPYSLDAIGNQCGARSAYSRSGGASPQCY